MTKLPSRFQLLYDSEPQPPPTVSTENLGAAAGPAFAPMVNLTTPEFRDHFESLYVQASGVSTEAVGMCNATHERPLPMPPVTVRLIGEKTLLLTFNYPFIPATMVSSILLNMDQLSPEYTLHVRVCTHLNEDTWLSLCSGLACCQAKTMFHVDLLSNVAAFLVMAVVDKIMYGPYSYFLVGAPVEVNATGTASDVELAVENAKRVHDQVIDFAVRANMATAEELKAVYEERSIFGLFGENLSKRLAQRQRLAFK